MSVYTTIQGDMWDSVSFKALGSTAYVDRLMMLNTEYIGTYIFPAGVTLELPELDEYDGRAPLPPWKETVG